MFSFSNLFKIKEPVFGLDISQLSLRAVELRRNFFNKLVVHSYSEEFLAQGIIENDFVIDEARFSESLNNLFKNAKYHFIKSKMVAVSLPESQTYTKVISFPKMPYKELKESIMWQIESNIPFKLDEIYFDWEILSSLEAGVGDHIDVLISASPKRLINQYFDVLKKIGLFPVLFKPESFAISRCVLKDGFSRNTVLILDLGENHTDIIVYYGAYPRFATTVLISGRSLSELIVSKLNVNFDKAEELKKQGSPEVYKILETPVKNLLDKIEEYLNFYYSNYVHRHLAEEGQVKKIILCGGGANSEFLAEKIQNRFKIQTVTANAWINILPIPENELKDLIYSRSLSFVTALGMALKALE